MTIRHNKNNTIENNLGKYLPIINWLSNYKKQDFNSDVFAGFITAILFIPQGMAYAMLAGLPIQVGLYASILPPIIYAFLGSSTTLSVGPVSIAAIMIASALSAPEIQALGNPVEQAIILAAEGGIILLLMASLRMGGLVNFISHPVLAGFTSGAAILIVLSQIPHLLGLPVQSCGLDLVCLSDQLQHANSYTTKVGIFSILVLIFMGAPLFWLLTRFKVHNHLKTAFTKSAPLLMIIITTALVTYYQLSEHHDVSVVGHIVSGLPSISLAFITNSSSPWIALLPSAAFISLIAYVESVAIAKVTANLRGEKIAPNQELIALGASNVASAVTGGMPVAGGFSRTMVNFSAGARTQLSMLIAVAFLMLAVVYFTDQFSAIPKAVLAAIILVAIAPLIKFREIISTWKYDAADGVAQFITLAGVLVLGIEKGIALGVLFTIISFLRRTSRPHIAVIGRIKNTEQFRNVDRHQVETWDNLLLFRIDENITFSNVDYIADFIEEHANNNEKLKHLVLVFSSVSYIDTTAIELLTKTIKTYKDRGVTLHLAEVKGPVMDKLQKTDFMIQLRSGKIFFHTTEAVEELGKT
ncbi:MAG: sulfate permease [Piscirickettsiaceae bacterium]|nr:sulfate permease [Piscirickettsiaceae bacterium]